MLSLSPLCHREPRGQGLQEDPDMRPFIQGRTSLTLTRLPLNFLRQGQTLLGVDSRSIRAGTSYSPGGHPYDGVVVVLKSTYHGEHLQRS